MSVTGPIGYESDTVGLTDRTGRALHAAIPGLIDAHGHVMGLGFQLMLLDLSGTNSLAEAQAAIRKYAAENPEMPNGAGR